MSQPLPPCRLCGGALQRVDSMPGHVVCGSGHLYLEKDAHEDAAKKKGGLERVGEDADQPSG